MKAACCALLLLSSTIASCSVVERNAAAAPARVIDLDCPEPDPGALLFWMEPHSAKRGGTQLLTPYLSTRPGSFEELPSACLSDVEVQPASAGPIVFSPDLGHRLILSETAPFDQDITVSAHYRGHALSSRLRVFEPVLSPLVGVWRQAVGTCDPEAVIRELTFDADGSMSVTWEPFEAYKDYWGSYTYDPHSAWLTLNADRGNMIPDDIRNGTVSLMNDSLTFKSASLGSRRKDVPPCAAPFDRVGG